MPGSRVRVPPLLSTGQSVNTDWPVLFSGGDQLLLRSTRHPAARGTPHPVLQRGSPQVPVRDSVGMIAFISSGASRVGDLEPLWRRDAKSEPGSALPAEG